MNTDAMHKPRDKGSLQIPLRISYLIVKQMVSSI